MVAKALTVESIPLSPHDDLMAKLRILPELAIINGLKGKIDFYLWMGIPVARRWPRSPGRQRATAVEAQWPAFSYASKLWGYMDEETQAAYRWTAHGTNLTGRDLQVRAYITGYLS